MRERGPAPEPPRETVYTFTALTEDDVIAMASGLCNARVRAMALLALSGPEELERNAEKPVRKRKTA